MIELRLFFAVAICASLGVELTGCGCSSSGAQPPVDRGDAGADAAGDTLLDGDAGEAGPPAFACSAPLDGTTATLFYDAARCLFEGTDPPQKGVTAGTIDRVRAAIVRGRVLDASQQPLAGTHIAILGHPEYGTTTSRNDGWFDMAVNGGGQIAVRYEAPGLLAAQRHQVVSQGSFAVYPDVVLIAPAAPMAVNMSQATAPVVIEQAMSHDASGDRHQVLLFPPGTKATLTLPDGTTQVLSTFHVRITEYTVGAAGPSAMPADLPPTSGYTYANEFSLDEARAAGAVDVQFDPPVVSYVENFLHFPVGTVVPSGFYDAVHDIWKGGDSGVILSVVSQTDGVAAVDADGDGKADDTAALTKVGIGPDELGVLGKRYGPGQSVWRVLLTHFSVWDSNWGFGPPNDATNPFASVFGPGSLDCASQVGGSIIGCEDQSLGEAIPVVGTPYTLHYQSQRMPGRSDVNRLDIQLSGPEVPASLKRIELDVNVLGATYRKTFPPAPNAKTVYEWDGKDGYGRTWQGEQRAVVRVGYVYDGSYEATFRFGYRSNGTVITGDKTRLELTIWSEFRALVGTLQAGPLGLGGWSLDAQHLYDPHAKVLYFGDGTRRSADKIGGVVVPFAGGGDPAAGSGDAGPATSGVFCEADYIVAAPDGTVFVSDFFDNKVRRISPAGIITTYAGTGAAGSAGDMGPAIEAQLNSPEGLALAPDGTLYIADNGNGRIRAVAPNGIITTYAGGGTLFDNEIPATTAFLAHPVLLALAPDGTLYFTDDAIVGLHVVTPDGIHTRLGVTFPGLVYGMAVSQTNEIYFALVHPILNGWISKLDNQGTLTTVLGDGTLEGDQLPAKVAAIHNPRAVAIGPDGSIYFRDNLPARIRRVTPGGFVETLAGADVPAGNPRQILPALATNLGPGPGIAIMAQGDVIESEGRIVRRIRPALPGFTGAEFAVAAADASVIYIFDDKGKHLRTTDALTNLDLLSFTYDSAGRLSGIDDQDGNKTTVTRDAQGNPATIVGPYGQTTKLTIGSDGYLAAITNPNGEATLLTYKSGGLLETKVDPRDPADVHRFSYDELGRLDSDTDPSGYTQTLSRTDAPDGHAVTRKSTLGRTSTYALALTGASLSTLTLTRADRTVTTTARTPLGVTAATPTATSSVTYAADPRFGMQSPVASLDLEEKGGPKAKIATTRTVELSDPANPFGVKKLTDTTLLNGRTFVTAWDAATLTTTYTSPRNRTAIRTFDAKNHLVSAKDGDLLPVTRVYDAHGRVKTITQDTRSVSFDYADNGWLASFTDPLGRVTKFSQDAAGRITGATLADGSVIGLAYDRNGNPTSLTPPSKPAHAMSYLPGDLLAKYSPPTAAGSGATSTAYSYDTDRMLSELLRPDQLKVSYARDNAGRLSALTVATGVVSYAYSDTTGQLATIRGTSGESVAVGYQGDLLTDETFSGVVSGTVHLTYDQQMQIATEVLNGGGSLAFEYDTDGLLDKVGDLTIGRSGQTALITSTALGAVTDDFKYNGFGEPTSYSAGAALLLENYTRDAFGRISGKTETVQGTAYLYAYAYDTRGRLTDVTIDGASASHHEYDANGNRVVLTTSSGTVNATYDAQDRILTQGTAAYTYGANGELATKTDAGQVTSYTYDALGALTKVVLPGGRTIEYVYDGLLRRVGKKVDGQLVQGFLYHDQLHPVAELDGAGNVVSRFVYGTRPQVPDYLIRGGINYRIVSDHLGSARLVVNTMSGAVVQRIDYDAWGNVLANSAPGFQPLGFAGGLYDGDTGLVRFGARDYDPAVARFVLKDPSGLAGGSNVYEYAANDPVNYIDPNGHFAILVPILTGAAVGGLQGAAFGIAGSLVAHGCIDWGEVGRDALVGAVGGALGGALGLVGRAAAGAAPVVEGVASDARLFELYKAELAAQEIEGAQAVGSALKSDPFHRAASFAVGDISAGGRVFTIGGRTGSANLTQVLGELNGTAGRFEWIVDAQGNLTHQMFVRGGGITGIPIVP